MERDERVAAIHANAEVFDEKAETSFKYLQVGLTRGWAPPGMIMTTFLSLSRHQPASHLTPQLKGRPVLKEPFQIHHSGPKNPMWAPHLPHVPTYATGLTPTAYGTSTTLNT